MDPVHYYLRCEAGHAIPIGVAQKGVQYDDVHQHRCLCGAPVELAERPAVTFVRADDEAWEAEEA